jgi:hypothetical protein
MEGESYWKSIREPLDYRVGAGYGIFLFVAGALEGWAWLKWFLPMLLSQHLRLTTDSFVEMAVLSLINLMMAFVVFAFLLHPFLGRIRITSQAAESRLFALGKSMLREETIGKTVSHVTGRNVYRLVSKSGDTMLIDPGTFVVDDNFLAWINSIETIKKQKRGQSRLSKNWGQSRLSK